MDFYSVLIFLLSTFQLACSFSLIHDYSLLKVMIGNITEMNDLSLPPMDQINVDEDEKPAKYEEDYDVFEINDTDVEKVLGTIEVDPKERKYAYAALEFNVIMKSLSEVENPRRWFGSFIKGAFNSVVNAVQSGVNLVRDVYDTLTPSWYDTGFYRGKEDSTEYDRKFEYKKMTKLKKLMICLLIHTRYRVDHALRQRKKSWNKKAYRLGYLFNRLRRVKYMQAKAVHTANSERLAADAISPWTITVQDNYGYLTLRWYEKMVHLDIDLRDLCSLIIEVLDEKVPTDEVHDPDTANSANTD